MFIKLSQTEVNNQVARPPHFEAQIDVGKRVRQAFIESADFLKYFAARQHTRAGDRAAVPGHCELAARAGMFCRNTAKSRLRNSVDAKDNPGVLDRLVRIQ